MLQDFTAEACQNAELIYDQLLTDIKSSNKPDRLLSITQVQNRLANQYQTERQLFTQTQQKVIQRPYCLICKKKYRQTKLKPIQCLFCGSTVCNNCTSKSRYAPGIDDCMVPICDSCQQSYIQAIAFKREIVQQKALRMVFQSLSSQRASLQMMTNGLRKTKQMLSKQLLTMRPTESLVERLQQIQKDIEKTNLELKNVKIKIKERKDYSKVLDNSIQFVYRSISQKKDNSSSPIVRLESPLKISQIVKNESYFQENSRDFQEIYQQVHRIQQETYVERERACTYCAIV